MGKQADHSNRLQHHTDLFSTDFLVVRRGQEFQIQISFSRPYDASSDKFAVEFGIGECGETLIVQL